MIWPFGKKKKARNKAQFTEINKTESEADFFASFSYIQRDGSVEPDILSRKPRILFASHPEDHEKCFRTVTDELLNRVDATVLIFTIVLDSMIKVINEKARIGLH